MNRRRKSHSSHYRAPAKRAGGQPVSIFGSLKIGKPATSKSSSPSTIGQKAGLSGETDRPNVAFPVAKRQDPVKRPSQAKSGLSTAESLACRNAGESPLMKIEAALQGALQRRKEKLATHVPKVTGQRHYQRESRRPWVCLLFVLPLVFIYESASLGVTASAVRSGVDQWISYFLNGLGLGQLVILPLLTSVVLLVAHYRQGDHWHCLPATLGWMTVESCGLGLILFWAANAVYFLFHQPAGDLANHVMPNAEWWSQTIAVIGSGIYEELVFRLILLTLLVKSLTRWTKLPYSQWLAIAVISILFSALHFDVLNPAGEPFAWMGFLFRCGASVIFSLLFLYRGFGIAVGTHVAYDLLTQL